MGEHNTAPDNVLPLKKNGSLSNFSDEKNHSTAEFHDETLSRLKSESYKESLKKIKKKAKELA